MLNVIELCFCILHLTVEMMPKLILQKSKYGFKSLINRPGSNNVKSKHVQYEHIVNKSLKMSK